MVVPNAAVSKTPERLEKFGVLEVNLLALIPDRLYCFATSRSMVNFTSSPTTAVGNFVAIPNAVRLIVVVPEKPE